MSDESRGFRPGDFAVLRNATHYHEYNGWLVEILERPCEKWVMDTRIMERVLIYAYPVRLICENAEALPGEGRFRCMPWQLRPLKGGSPVGTETATVAERGHLKLTACEAIGGLAE